MTAGWVAASTRGGALLGHLVGPEGARELAAIETWPEARHRLEPTLYGRSLAPDADRSDARRTAIEATSWQLRVLSGWLPVGGGSLARLFAAPLEIANIEAHIAALQGAARVEPVTLGSLSVAWRRAAATTSLEQLRAVLTHSAWGDPGSAEPAAIVIGLRLSWARRLVRGPSETAPYGRSGAAVLLARELFAFRRQITPATEKQFDRLLGDRWHSAPTVSDLVRALPDAASWPFEDVVTPSELWRAESAVLRRAASDASRLATTRHPTRTTVAAIMALLLIDLWRVIAAIELAGRSPDPVEVFDAVA